MLFKTKLNLDRFKKSLEGLIAFASLIEQADPDHREKILEQAKSQDADFVFRAMRKVVLFEEFIYLDETTLAEILSKTSAKTLAYALFGTPKEFRDKVLSQVGHRELRQIRDEEEKLVNILGKSLVRGGQRQILKIARQLEKQNKFVFELADCPRFNTRKKKAVGAR